MVFRSFGAGLRALTAMGAIGVLGALGACGDNRRPQTNADAAPDAAADAGPGFGCVPNAGTRATVRKLVKVDEFPVLVTSPPGDSRLFIMMREGQILLLQNGQVAATPFLDLSADAGGPVLVGAERGLLGLAFHPRYAENRTFYVFYTTRTANVLARYMASEQDPSRAVPGSGEVLLSIADPYPNHNGGNLAFGPDGFLYLGTGDGGSGNDPSDFAQTPTELLGKMLRLDVDRADPPRAYGIPAGNPFADGQGGAPEVLMLGLRNPWRWSFDTNGDLFIGDVGQDGFEELTVIPAGTAAGRNLGWRRYEGETCVEPGGCDPAGKTFPQLTLAHSDASRQWCSIIGGAVYRGACFPGLTGRYFYTDHCDAGLYSLRWQGGAITDRRVDVEKQLPSATNLSVAAGGELYATTGDGWIWRVEAAP